MLNPINTKMVSVNLISDLTFEFQLVRSLILCPEQALNDGGCRQTAGHRSASDYFYLLLFKNLFAVGAFKGQRFF